MANKVSDVYRNLTRIYEDEARIRVDLPENTLPLALSIELPGGYVSEVVPAGIRLPVDSTKMFSTAGSFQMAAEFNVLFGSRPLACDNYDLCRIRVRNIKWSGAGVPQIELRFKVDEAGLIAISAANLDRNNAEILVFMARENISRDEIESALTHVREHAAEDNAMRNHIQNSLECYALIGAINDYYGVAKRKLGYRAKSEYKKARKRLQNALQVKPADATPRTIAELDEATKAFREQHQKILPAYKQVMAWYA
ncbi:MAG: Hsp70 family protein [Coriobacteriales bacterium]|jgi:molecular chaperone DnaK|nr:Hsp70 family protein [Coriobacteriales bacterium]